MWCGGPAAVVVARGGEGALIPTYPREEGGPEGATIGGGRRERSESGANAGVANHRGGRRHRERFCL